MNTGQELPDWGFEPISAQCYLGACGIAAVLESGADIVVCGRVADASVCVGPAMYWHGWSRTNLDELANTLMVGHIIECSTYATGGYYSGFKQLGNRDVDMGYPIATIDHKGEVCIVQKNLMPYLIKLTVSSGNNIDGTRERWFSILCNYYQPVTL